MKIIGNVFMVLGGIIWAISGLWGLIISLKIVNYAAGFWGVIIGFFIFPVTFTAAPWYALVQWGTWFPLILNYGGLITGGLLFGLGTFLKEK
ncbi:MAG: hypothetical protein ABIG94_11765 [Pseudomonadota bacterium]